VTCAICVSDRGPFTREPLGRGDALVDVCSGCTTLDARHYTFNGGRGDMRGMTAKATTLASSRRTGK
jgi:hypothetical protein